MSVPKSVGQFLVSFVVEVHDAGKDDVDEVAHALATAFGFAPVDTVNPVVRTIAVKFVGAVRSCPRCGCTDERACEGGCAWVAGRQECSRCLQTRGGRA